MGKTGGSVFAIAMLAVVLSACADSAMAPESKPTSPELVPSSAITVTPRLDERTPTPDLSSALPSNEAWDALMEVSGVAEVLTAIEDGDVDELLRLIRWTEKPCGTRATSRCLEGIAPGTELPMVNVGDIIAFWVTEEAVREARGTVITDFTLELRFGSRNDSSQNATYYLGLEGPTRNLSSSVVSGLFLVLESDPAAPLIELRALTSTWSAVQAAYELGVVDGHTILAFDP